MIGKADLYDGVNAQLTNDRSGRPCSALSLTIGYYKVPNGIYFTGDFTVMVWVKARSYRTWSRVIDFASAGPSNAFIFALTGDTVGRPTLELYSSGTTLRVQSTVDLGLNTWVHVACTLAQTSGLIYRNGVAMSTLISAYTAGPQNIIRTLNYVGRSNWYPGNDDTDADFDELKIFNRALTQQEIANEMNNNMFL